jgi:hypothetical protein
LADGFARELQPTGKPNEFWAVIYNQQKRGASIGRYDSKNFSFTPVIELPELRLTSNDFWVDAAAGKIWITYQGQLLRLPLPTQPRDSAVFNSRQPSQFKIIFCPVENSEIVDRRKLLWHFKLR